MAEEKKKTNRLQPHQNIRSTRRFRVAPVGSATTTRRLHPNAVAASLTRHQLATVRVSRVRGRPVQADAFSIRADSAPGPDPVVTLTACRQPRRLPIYSARPPPPTLPWALPSRVVRILARAGKNSGRVCRT
jgi:hypothetical protein